MVEGSRKDSKEKRSEWPIKPFGSKLRRISFVVLKKAGGSAATSRWTRATGFNTKCKGSHGSMSKYQSAVMYSVVVVSFSTRANDAFLKGEVTASQTV